MEQRFNAPVSYIVDIEAMPAPVSGLGECAAAGKSDISVCGVEMCPLGVREVGARGLAPSGPVQELCTILPTGQNCHRDQQID